MQIDDFNPGIDENEVFWTAAVPNDSVETELDEPEASLDVENLMVKDFFTIENALFGGGPTPVPGRVSFEIEFEGGSKVTVNDTVDRFHGEYFRGGKASIEWSAHAGNIRFKSGPARDSITTFSEFGTERNGVFFS